MKPQALEVYKIFEKLAGESQAKIMVEYFENADTSAIDKAIHSKIEHLATKEELGEIRKELAETKSELIKTIYIVGLVQFLAIIGSVLAIVNFMLK